MQGFYPSGIANSNDSFIPHGSLMKALIIASGTAETGEVVTEAQDKPTTVEPPPSYFQGYGRVELTNILYFKDSNSNPTLWLHQTNQTAKISTSELQSFCFKVSREPTANANSNSNVNANSSANAGADALPFKATLVWTDPVGSLASRVNLVNNLDLFINIGHLITYLRTPI